MWVLNIFYGFDTHTSNLKSMERYAKYKVSMIKEEGDTSHVCQRYDQYSSKKDNASFREDNYFLHSRIPATRGVLNSWCMVNVGLQAVKKLTI